MKLKNEYENYSGLIIRLSNLQKLEGSDFLLGFPCLGMMALVHYTNKEGDIGVFFPAECQLSESFCKENNLFKNSELNSDPEQKGYLESNRRIKALKLRGHKSTGFWVPASYLSYLGITEQDLIDNENQSFTHINGSEVCRKYKIQQQESKNKQRGLKKKFKRADSALFPEYIDTDNFWRNIHLFGPEDEIIVTQKLHGTSARFSNTKVKKFSKLELTLNRVDDYFLSLLKRKGKFFGKLRKSLYQLYFDYVSSQLSRIRFSNKTEYACLAGSRRVIKDTMFGNNDHYYDTDVWNENLHRISHLIPKNVVIYGELIGWNGEKPLQQNYTYKIPKGENKFYVYRISMVNEDGFEHIWSWDDTVDFCKNNGLLYVPEIWRGKFKDFDEQPYMNVKYVDDMHLLQCVPCDKSSPCDEGLIIRKGSYVAKAKSPDFLLHETKQIDSGQIDLESQESEVE